ncbi:MAG: MarR family transcriptional regulator [Gammaproteobacteria bacterium]|nr:MarR family transcriptional regulator [Gammaproteobacteria bacterium]MCP4088351.1 MarR family transcriptional regulator [Gammaproteobacteria bacterium]MCP4275111.1 MarR family transcriptional regulator [Gammaproteobacteria bacterium]MCP4830985.1 MarR family transcriptional regulator [Gammaproteobacteria bacterium]MCP4927494.1 MarR family transcriptional regulator [Gammaproteobacteria bacterium]
MSDNLPNLATFNEMMGECFRLNRSLVDVAQQLTDGMGVTGTQWGVLGAFGQDEVPGTVAKTARQMGLARQSVQRIADVLADKKLINYLPSLEDKRAQLVEVTTTGRTLLTELEQRQQVWIQSIAGSYCDADIDAVIRLVKIIRQQIDKEYS